MLADPSRSTLTPGCVTRGSVFFRTPGDKIETARPLAPQHRGSDGPEIGRHARGIRDPVRASGLVAPGPDPGSICPHD